MIDLTTPPTDAEKRLAEPILQNWQTVTDAREQLDSTKTVQEVEHIDSVISQVAVSLDQVAQTVQDIKARVMDLEKLANRLSDEE